MVSEVPSFWVFPGWHFAHSDSNGPVGLVNGSVGKVTSRHHTGHYGGLAIITSHSGRYLLLIALLLQLTVDYISTAKSAGEQKTVNTKR